jgi:putative endonuclease
MNEKGLIGETLATMFLKKRGYEIIERNYRIREGEIDIIARKNGELIFIEVKTISERERAAGKRPEEAIDQRKRARLRKAIASYLGRHQPERWSCATVGVVVRDDQCGGSMTLITDIVF